MFHSVAANRMTAVKSCHGVGKAIQVDTPVLTRRGWVTMGELVSGDHVRHPDGSWTRVLEAFDAYETDTYTVTFNDATIEADADHRWVTIPMSRRHKLRHVCGGITDWRDMLAETQMITTAGIRDSCRTNLGQANHLVPLCRPLEGEGTPPVDPYTFGYWLGNGTRGTARVTCHEDDADELNEWIGTKDPQRPNESKSVVLLTNLWSYVQQFNAEKFIPDVWQTLPVADRMMLVRGMMDADGSVHKGTSGAEIGFKEQRMTEQLQELFRGLGVSSTVTVKPVTRGFEKEYGPQYRLNVTPTWNPFRLTRKADAYQVPMSPRPTARTIVSVKPSGRRATVRCIAVEAPDHLWLVGRELVVTHNSYGAAALACWWLDSHAPGEAFVLTSAPTAIQVRALLWRYIGRFHAVGGLAGRIAGVEWKMFTPHGNEELVGIGRKSADANPSGMQGIHAPYLLVLIDEACGIVPGIWDALMSTASNEDAHVCAIGNPDIINTRFHSAFDADSKWHKITISAFDSPNYTGEECPPEIAKQLIGPLYVDEMKRLGEESPIYRSKVLGEFTADSTDAIIPASHVLAARKRGMPDWLIAMAPEGLDLDPDSDEGLALVAEWEYSHLVKHPVVVGVDVGGGGDYTAITVTRGWKLLWQEKRTFTEQTARAEWVYETIATWWDPDSDLPIPMLVNVDAIGIGDGLIAPLKMWRMQGVLPSNLSINEVNVASKAHNDEFYANLRAELVYSFRQSIPQMDLAAMVDECAEDLSAYRRKKTLNARRHLVEEKSETRKRIGRSPDYGDSCLLGFYSPPQPDTGVVVPDSVSRADPRVNKRSAGAALLR